MLMSGVKSDIMAFAEQRFILEQWRKVEFDVCKNDIKQGITICQYLIDNITVDPNWLYAVTPLP